MKNNSADTMRQLIVIAIVALQVWQASARSVTNMNSGTIYEASRDEFEEMSINLARYDTAGLPDLVEWPAVVRPFGFSSDYFNSFADASPADSVRLFSLPYSNVRGEARISYHLALPKAHHGLVPDMKLTYNSSRNIENLGYGWKLEMPMVEIDTLRSADTEPDRWKYLLCGRPIEEGKKENDTTTAYFFQKNHAFETIKRIGNNGKYKWVYEDGRGRTYYFGNKENGKVENEIKVIGWTLDSVKNQYGDYLRYAYDKNGTDSIPVTDTIYAGGNGRRPYTRYLIRRTKGTGTVRKGITFSNRCIEDIKIFFQKKKDKNQKDKWEYVHSEFQFEVNADLLTKVSHISHKGGNMRNSETFAHTMEYYDDAEEAVKQRDYRNDYKNISLDSLIVDRTKLLKTVHTPLGGCFSLDYTYSGCPDTLKAVKVVRRVKQAAEIEELLSELYAKVEDSIHAKPEYRAEMDTFIKYYVYDQHEQKADVSLIPFDTLVRRYFEYTDARKGVRVMSRVWMTDGFFYDGPSTDNRISYTNPYCDSLGTFLGFAAVQTDNYSTSHQYNNYMRQQRKVYNTSSINTFGLIDSVMKGNFFQKNVDTTIYSWASVSKKGAHNNILTGKTVIDGNEVRQYNYEYNLRIPNTNLTHPNYVGKITYPDKSWASYYYNENGQLDRYEDSDTNNVRVIRNTKENKFFQITNRDTTRVDYDKDGNVSRIFLHAGVMSRYIFVNYLYDRDQALHLERVEDQRGLRTELEQYDTLSGRPRLVRDMNGYETKFSYTYFGRVDTILAPNEQDAGKKYSIRYAYKNYETDASAEVCSEKTFIDSLELRVPAFIMEGEVSDSVRLNILAELKGLTEKRKDSTAMDELLKWDACLLPMFDTTEYMVSYDTIDVNSCHCNDISKPAIATTMRCNPARGKAQYGDVETTLFADGFGRPIQRRTKESVTTFRAKDLEGQNVNDKDTLLYVTKDAKKYDDLARIVTSFQPYNIVWGKKKNNDAIKDEITSIDKDVYRGTSAGSVSPDALDRTYSFGSGTNVSYSNEREFAIKYKNESDDVREHVKMDIYGNLESATFTVSNKHSKIVGYGIPPFTVTEAAKYLRTGQQLFRKDRTDSIGYTYDKYGRDWRITEEVSKQHGTTTYAYDDKKNTITKSTPEGETITYAYDRDNLVGIYYSAHPADSVRFYYGDKNSKHGRAGRLAMMTDATGVQEYYYGRNGEVTKVRRTIIIPNKTIETYVTQYKYDTWGKPTEVTYPDGEVLKYKYNAGGRTESISGDKAYSYNYVHDMGYDIYGNLSKYTYCNGTKTLLSSGYNYMKVIDEKNANIFSEENNEIGATFQKIDTFNAMKRMTTTFTLYPTGDLSNSDISVAGATLTDYCTYRDNGLPFRTFLSYKLEGDALKSYYFNYSYNATGATQHDMYGTNLCYQIERNKLGLNSSVTKSYLPYPMPENAPEGGFFERLMDYDTEGRMTALNNCGYIYGYWYDGQGKRTVRMHGSNGSIYVNSKQAREQWGNIDGYEVYVNDHFERLGDSIFVKHVLLDGRPVVSKIVNLPSYGASAERLERAGSSLGVKIDYKSLYSNAYAELKQRYKAFDATLTDTEVPYKSYTEGLRSANIDMGNDNYEDVQYYYHRGADFTTIATTDLKRGISDYATFSLSGKRLYGYSKEEGVWTVPFWLDNMRYDADCDLFYLGNGRYYSPEYDYRYFERREHKDLHPRDAVIVNARRWLK